jgi:hypothetical protein
MTYFFERRCCEMHFADRLFEKRMNTIPIPVTSMSFSGLPLYASYE